MKIDLKSAGLGLLIGAAAMCVLGDATRPNDGRYQVSTGANFVAIVDSQTGEVWGHPANTDDQGGSRGGMFWGPKGQ